MARPGRAGPTRSRIGTPARWPDRFDRSPGSSGNRASSRPPGRSATTCQGLSPSDAATIERTLADRGLRAKLVYSSGRHLDILPSGAGKGLASRFLAESWAIPPSSVLAFGDSGNDRELLASGFKGTVVGNALPEILAAVGPEVYRSPAPFADGILDGIRHWSSQD